MTAMTADERKTVIDAVHLIEHGDVSAATRLLRELSAAEPAAKPRRKKV